MLASPGVLRPHCEGSCGRSGARSASSNREGRAKRSIRETASTTSTASAGRGSTVGLDMVPLLISPSVGRLGQLLRSAPRCQSIWPTCTATDVLAARLLPPALVFSNPAFLRPCHTCATKGSSPRARGGSGALAGRVWWVSPTGQAPSGAGYALEIGSCCCAACSVPRCQVHRLASFFRAQRGCAVALAPQRTRSRGRALTPRPHNKTYFEHAYLRAVLGFTMVEGGDGSADRRVFIKTLEPSTGRRHLPEARRRFLRPARAAGDSSLGVAGLVEARAGRGDCQRARLGRDRNGGVMPFLPGLCRHLLGRADVAVGPAVGRTARELR